MHCLFARLQGNVKRLLLTANLMMTHSGSRVMQSGGPRGSFVVCRQADTLSRRSVDRLCSIMKGLIDS